MESGKKTAFGTSAQVKHMKFFTLNQLPLYTEDFSFTFTDKLNIRDAIVIFNPMDSLIF